MLSNPELLMRMDELGFRFPTEIQALAISKALEGKDLILKAKTGSGKTLAFVIPLLDKFEKISREKSETAALMIAPTRELALQIQEVICKLNPTLAPVLIIGGVDEKKQKSALDKDPRIVVGTPGRLLDLIKKRVLNLKKCRYFVLDEADEMLSMGFIEDIRAILSRLPKSRQGLFVSATINPRVEMLASSFLTKSEYLLAEHKEDESPQIEHLYCETGGELLSKALALCDLIEAQNPRSAIIFCNTRAETEFVELLLRRRGFDARRMNSDLSQSQRQKVISKIKSEDLRLLVATDIAARGIDIAELDLVINYSLHDQAETYTHRTGRTGRAGLKGRAISIVGPRDFGAFHYLTKALDLDFKKIELPSDEEVANARLVHLYQKLREQEEKIDLRALLVASKLIQDHGGSENLPEELLEITGRLCEFTLAHSVSEESKSLDEELLINSEKEAKRERSSRKENNRERNPKSNNRNQERDNRDSSSNKDPESTHNRDRDRSERERPERRRRRNFKRQ